MLRKLFFWSRAGAALAGALAFSGCLKAPEYAVEPVIAFESIRLRTYPGTGRVDSVRVTVSFKDGDGDLGLGGKLGVFPADEQKPYAYLNIVNRDTTINPFYNNYFIEPYVKNRSTGVFEKLPDSRATSGGYNGRYPRLTAAETKPAPLKGTISRNFALLYGLPFVAGEEVRFEVSILDRALHVSNTITTTSIILPR